MDLPDIPAVQTSNAISIAVARKALETQRSLGSAVVELVRQAGQVASPSRGSVTPAEPGRLDLYA